MADKKSSERPSEEYHSRMRDFFALMDLPYLKEYSVSIQLPEDIPLWVIHCFYCKNRKTEKGECSKISVLKDKFRSGVNIEDCEDYDEDLSIEELDRDI